MKKLKTWLQAFVGALSMMAMNICAAATETSESGGNLASSKAVTGTKALLNDLSNVLLVVAPIVGTVCIIFFAIRHGAADEMDQKKWKQRIIVAAVSVVVAVLASALINVLVGYYQ